MDTAGEIVIWMVLAALVGFATGWALRSVVANRQRHRLSERLEEKRREAQQLREELRHLRGDDDEDVVHLPAGGTPELEGWGEAGGDDFPEADHSQTAEHDEVELGPLDDLEPTGSEEIGGSTRSMQLGEVEWEDVDDPPHRRDDEA